MNQDLSKIEKLTATYYRVSTSNQEEAQTIQTQISAVKEFASKNHIKIIQEYMDDGWSGDTLIRPALDQLRVDARKKMWEAVLVYDPDRLARRYSYQELVMDELKEAGIEVIFVTTPAPKNSEDKILHGVKGLFAEYERAKISERFRLGKLRKAKEGHIMTSEALYGYRYIPRIDKEQGRYEINEEEARVVKMIFKWVGEEGLTLRAVVKRLMDVKIRPRKSKKGVWATSTLTTMLRHKGYIGEAHWGKSYAVVPENPYKIEKYRKQKKSSRRDRPEEEWYIIPIPRIIDRELFERVRKQLQVNFALCKRNKRNDYLLASKIWCSCGSRRCGCGPQKGKHLYYRCNDRIKSFPLPAKCKEGAVNARIGDQLVWERVANLMSSPELLLKQAERWLNNRQSKKVSSLTDIKDLEKESKKLKDQEERYNKAYGVGLLSMEQLRDYTIPIRERLGVVDSQIIKTKEENNQIVSMGMPSKKEVEIFAKVASRKLRNLNFELKREIVLSTVEKVVGNQEKLQVYGYIPINHVLFSSEYRHCRAAERGEVHAL